MADAGPTVPAPGQLIGGSTGGETENPKFKGTDAKQVRVDSGMNVGGNTDAQVRINAWSQGSMLSRQLKKNKSASSPLP